MVAKTPFVWMPDIYRTFSCKSCQNSAPAVRLEPNAENEFTEVNKVSKGHRFPDRRRAVVNISHRKVPNPYGFARFVAFGNPTSVFRLQTKLSEQRGKGRHRHSSDRKFIPTECSQLARAHGKPYAQKNHGTAHC